MDRHTPMSNAVSILFYILVFCALYSQVFFLFSFIEKRKNIKSKDNALTDDELPAITCIVPCWNEERTVARTIRSLRAVEYPREKLHLIFVDDGSTDRTWNVLSRYKTMPNVTILRKENGGKHTALNFALPYVTTPLVSSFDADTLIAPDALRKIAAYFSKDSGLSAVGGTVLIDNPKTITQKAQNIEYQMFAYSKKVLGLLGGVLVVPGAFSVFKTEALALVGGYKRGHNLEDLELTYRLQVKGHKVDHAHDAVVYTKGPDSILGLFKQRLRWSYGFINNTLDYRYTIFNRKFGNFGIFTVPMSAFAYVIILAIFFMTWYRIFEFLIQKFVALKLVGAPSVAGSLFAFDWFFVNTEALVFLSAAMYGFIFLSIYLGRRLSKVSTTRSYAHVFWFLVLYSAVVPFWIIKSLYSTARSTRPSWR